MSFNITEFSQEIRNNGTHLNSHYDINVGIPPLLQGKTNFRLGTSSTMFDQSKKLTMRASKVAIPGVALRSSLNNIHGTGGFERFPFSPGFTETAFSFICDKEGDVWNFWYMWLNNIINFTDPSIVFGEKGIRYGVSYKDDYVTDMVINKYDKSGATSLTSIMTRAFPYSILEVPLDWKDNTLTQIHVGISFKDWYINNSQLR